MGDANVQALLSQFDGKLEGARLQQYEKRGCGWRPRRCGYGSVTMKLDNILKQTREMQSKLSDAQDSLVKATATGESGAGLVKVTMNGRYETLRVDPSNRRRRTHCAGGFGPCRHQRRRASHRRTAEGEDEHRRSRSGLAPGVKLPFI